MATISDLSPENTIVDSDGNEAKVSGDHLKIEIKQSDFRLMLAYQYRILKQLEKLNEYMSLITGDEL